jgi:pSer/pThr/pTyr-binding forkhead associated (FHA) protein
MDVNLVLLRKDGSHQAFGLPSNIMVVGRRHDCDLQVPLTTVSRRHCQLSQNKDTLKIRDLGSRNGTYVNDRRVDEATLKAGDYIRIGPLTFLLQIDGQPQEIAPAEQQGRKEAKPEKAKPKEAEAEESDIFADLDEDASDSFLAELEDL